MIIESILTFFSLPTQWLIDLLPTIGEGIEIPSNIYNVLEDLISCVGYVLPIQGLMPIWYGLVGLTLAKTVWALIIRIKSFIPTMGD